MNRTALETWQVTFRKTFGMTIEEFYRPFETHRADGFPDLVQVKADPGPLGALLGTRPPYSARTGCRTR